MAAALAAKLLCVSTAPLERPGRARRVDDGRRRVAIDGRARHAGGWPSALRGVSSSMSTTGLSAGNSPRCASRGDDQLRLGVADDMGDLALPIQDVDRDQDHAGLHAGEEQVDELDAVRQVHREPIARLEPALSQHGRDPRGAVRNLAKRQLLPTAGSVTDQATVPGASAQGQVEQVAEEHGGIVAAGAVLQAVPNVSTPSPCCEPTSTPHWRMPAYSERQRSGHAALVGQPESNI